MTSRIKPTASRLGISTNILPHIKLVGAVEQLSNICATIELEIEGDSKELINNSNACRKGIEALSKLQKTRDLTFSIHAPHKGYNSNLAATDEFTRRSFCQELERLIDFSAEIGAEIITCHPGYSKTNSKRDSIENLYRSLNELYIYASDRSIMICLENMGLERGSCLVLSPEEHVQICQRTGTWLTLDMVHLLSSSSQISQVYKQLLSLLPYIRNIHIADMLLPHHMHLPLGKGNLPISQIFEFLLKNRYQGNVMVDATGGSDFPSHIYIEQFFLHRHLLSR